MLRDMARDNERLRAALAAQRARHGVFLSQADFAELQARKVRSRWHGLLVVEA